MSTITISFGINNSVTREAGNYPTVSSVLQDGNLKQFLGFGNNVEALVNGVTADAGQELVAGDRIELRTRANVKG